MEIWESDFWKMDEMDKRLSPKLKQSRSKKLCGSPCLNESYPKMQ